MNLKKILLCALLLALLPSVAHASPSFDGEIIRLSDSIGLLKENTETIMESIKDEEQQVKNDQRLREYIADYSISVGGVSQKDADEYGRVIVLKARKYNFDPFLITAMVQTESTFNRHAVGTSQDTGPMQLLPGTARGVAKSLGMPYSYDRLFLIEYNIELGAKYLSDNRGYFLKNGSYGYSPTYLAVIGYNRGPGRALKEASSSRLVKSYGDKVYTRYKSIKNDYMKQQ